MHPPDNLPSAEFTQYQEHGQHYNEADFWRKLKNLPRSALGQVLEKALILRELLLAPATPLWVKATIAGVLGYLILPFDLVPDLLPGVGLLDDAAALALVLARLEDWVTAEIRERARRQLPEFLRGS